VNGTKSDKQRPYVQARLLDILKTNVADIGSANWELVYFALQTIATLCQLFPSAVFAANSAPLWIQVRLCLSFPHAWVKLSAAKLIGLYIADFGRANAETGLRSYLLPEQQLWSLLQRTSSSLLELAPGFLEFLASVRAGRTVCAKPSVPGQVYGCQ
jgi:U3 small nucleolar RNA-associated protein 20